MKKVVCIIWSLLACFSLYSQGKLLLIGGGIENRGGWSDTPYKWAIEQSANKRVAVLSYVPAIGDRLADYFVYLGAESARNFDIHKGNEVNEQWFYDSLMQYDAIFLSRAKPSDYYHKLVGSQAQQAIQNKFKQGGVIGGSDGGAVVLGNFFLDESKDNAKLNELKAALKQQKLALYRDFIPLLSTYFIDTEFSRKGGMIGMLAGISYLWQQENKIVKGLGIDEKTALCIDAKKQGWIYGLGAIHLYLSADKTPEYPSSDRFFSNAQIRLMQLLHGSIFDFKSDKAQGLTKTITPLIKEEKPEPHILLSGSNTLSENMDFLEAFINAEDTHHPIVIIGGADTTLSETIEAVLVSLGAASITYISSKAEKHDRASLNQIGQASKILFLSNTAKDLVQLLSQNSYESKPLIDNLRNKDRVLAFMGDDSRFAGKAFLTNYQSKWAAYEGKLGFEKGLGLFSATSILTNPFFNPDYVENILAGTPYGMVKDSLLYSLFIPENSYISCSKEGGLTYIKAYGDNLPILFKNPGLKAGFANTYRGVNRNIVGFDAMQMMLLDKKGIMLGVNEPEVADTTSIKNDWLTVYPNPVKDKLHVLFYGNQVGRFTLYLKDSSGRTLFSKTALITLDQTVIEVDVSKVPRGIHALSVFLGEKRIIKKLRVIK